MRLNREASQWDGLVKFAYRHMKWARAAGDTGLARRYEDLVDAAIRLRDLSDPRVWTERVDRDSADR